MWCCGHSYTHPRQEVFACAPTINNVNKTVYDYQKKLKCSNNNLILNITKIVQALWQRSRTETEISLTTPPSLHPPSTPTRAVACVLCTGSVLAAGTGYSSEGATVKRHWTHLSYLYCCSVVFSQQWVTERWLMNKLAQRVDLLVSQLLVWAAEGFPLL